MRSKDNYKFPIELSGGRLRAAKLFVPPLALALPLSFVWLLGDLPHLWDNLLHGGSLWTAGILFALLTAGILVTGRSIRVRIDETGILVKEAKRSFFYAWHDLERVEIVRYGIRLDVRGHFESFNQYNVVPADLLGIKKKMLLEILQDGMRRFPLNWGGEQSRLPLKQTYAQGERAFEKISNIQTRMLAFLVAVYVIGGGAAICWLSQDELRTELLQARGTRVEAELIRLYMDNCGKRGCSVDVEYEFRPSARGRRAEPVRGHAYLAGSNPGRDPDYRHAVSENSVPIVYDPLKPSRSALNFRDQIFTNDPKSTFKDLATLIGGIFTLAFAIVSVPIWFGFESEKRKLKGR